MVDITSIGQAASAYASAMRRPEEAESSGPVAEDFSKMVADALMGTASQIDKAEKMSTQAALGQKVDLTDLITAISSAELALNTIISIRDKAIGAYQDIIKMPI